MENKQTAVEWLMPNVLELTIQLSNKKISQRTCELKMLELFEQAKAMERDHHQETFKQSRQAKIFEQDMPPVWKSFEQYYNETFKSE